MTGSVVGRFSPGRGRRTVGLLAAMALVLVVGLAVCPSAHADTTLSGVPTWNQHDLNTPALRSSGCAATSLAMLCYYYGSGKGLQDSVDRFIANGIVDPSGWVNHRRGLIAAVGGTAVVGHETKPANLTEIRSELDAGRPVEAYDDSVPHHYVIVGYAGSTFYINDPASGTFKANPYRIDGFFTYGGTHTPPVPPQGPKNLLSNAGFEHSMAGWSPIGPAGVNFARYTDASFAHDGSGFMETNTAVAGGSMAHDVAVSTTPGQSYTFSVWLRSRTSTPVSGSVTLWGMGGTNEAGATGFTVGPAWTLVSAPLDVANAGHTQLRAQIYIATTGAGLDVDGATFARGNAGSAATTPAAATPDGDPPITIAAGRNTGWTKSPVKLTFNAVDSSSGVAYTECRVGAGAWRRGTSLAISSAGQTAVSYRSADNAGNVEEAKSTIVRIDTRRPTVKAYAASVRRGRTTKLRFRIRDRGPSCGSASGRIAIKRNGRTVKTLGFRTSRLNATGSASFKCRLARGSYTWSVVLTDAAGNRSAVSKAKLRVL